MRRDDSDLLFPASAGPDGFDFSSGDDVLDGEDDGGLKPLLGDDYYMRAALRCAQQAADAGEVPVGAVAVKDGLIIARSWNQVELLKDATAHAELMLIASLPQIVGDWRLDGIDIYVTKEPCAMCAGAMVNSRIRRVIYGLRDPRCGAAGSALNVTGFPGMLHNVEVVPGFMEDECKTMFQEFFRTVRANARKKKSGFTPPA